MNLDPIDILLIVLGVLSVGALFHPYILPKKGQGGQQPSVTPVQPLQTTGVQNPVQTQAPVISSVPATPNAPPTDDRVIPIGFLLTALIAVGLGMLNQHVGTGVLLIVSSVLACLYVLVWLWIKVSYEK